MLAVTIAVGDAYLELTERAAWSVRRHTGVQTMIVDDPDPDWPPAYEKLRLFDRFDGPLLYFDADTFTVARWWPTNLAKNGWMAAVLDYASRARNADCERYRIDPERYVNTGVMILHPHHKPVLELAREIACSPDYRTGFKFEQTAVNVAAQRLGVSVLFLDRRYNVICADNEEIPSKPVILHAGGGGVKSRNRRRFEEIVAQYETKEAA